MQKFHSKMTPRSLYTQFPLTEITYAKVCNICTTGRDELKSNFSFIEFEKSS